MLRQNLKGFLRKSEVLRVEYRAAGMLPYASAPFLREASRQMIIVRLQDHWAHFVKQLIVLSASGKAHTTSGIRVVSAHGLNSVNEVEAWLTPYTPSAREPDWHVAQTSLRLARLLSVSNIGNISAALGSVNSPETDIRTYRNYIVHRNKGTAGKLRQMVRSNGWRPSDIALLPDIYTTGGKRLWETWLDDLQAVARVASA